MRDLSEREIKWLAATPLQEPADAGFIVWRAREGNGIAFASFARREHHLFERQFVYSPPKYLYRLSVKGREWLDEHGVRRNQ